MLSGAKDEIVPKEHMRALWEAVAKRGEKKTPGGKEYKTGLERAKYMEFEDGTHSASLFYHSKARLTNSLRRYLCADWLLDCGGRLCG